VEGEQAAFEREFGSYPAALARLEAMGSFQPLKPVRREIAKVRAVELGVSEDEEADLEQARKIADREARRAVSETGKAESYKRLSPEQGERARALAESYLVHAAALEVLRVSELARVYRAYEEERQRRGALDFGDQIAAVVRLFRRRPNVLRLWQRRFRYILVDEFQDANIAQIELVELLGRTPDRPDNVMVVGDDDQSIYRFRGASYAAFVELDRRFAAPPPHDPAGPAPGPPRRLRMEENFRSRPPVLAVANRLIGRNRLRYVPDKSLIPTRTEGPAAPVELWRCDGPDGEAAAIVEAIRATATAATGGDPEARPPWGSFAVLYRKHRHREAIVSRLREEGIPYTVAGGLSLFALPEIRDLEQAVRMLGDPFDDVAVARVLTSGPWRLDAVELLGITRAARRAERHLVETIRDAVRAGEVEIDALPGPEGEAVETASAAPAEPPGRDRRRVPARTVALGAETRAKLRRFLETLDLLSPEATREGPFTILERWLERTGMILDLMTSDTIEAKRAVANLASFLRFAADWQREHPAGSLQVFVDYLDGYQSAGGELPTSVEVAEDIEGVRLMSLYQAKGLEYPHVFIPALLQGEWPVRDREDSLFPRALVREVVPQGDVHTEEERRLLYVAITRAEDRLVLTTQEGPSVTKKPSQFLGEVTEGAGSELTIVDRTGGSADAGETGDGAAARAEERAGGEDEEDADGASAITRVVPMPTARERRAELRRQAMEVLSLIEGGSPEEPEAADAREAHRARLVAIADALATSADAARAQGLDPLTLRTLTADAGAGANLLSVAPLPPSFSYTQLDTYERCPTMFAFRYVYRIPTGEVASALTFGVTAHSAFERFTSERRRRLAAGEPPPTKEELQAWFREEWRPEGFPDRTAEESYRRRVGSMIDGFWEDELVSSSEALHEELSFELSLDPGDGSPKVRIGGQIDRVDRLPSGGIDVIDYKTGKIRSQKDVDENLQLSLYALAARDALGLGTPERVTLYFTEERTRRSTQRTEEQLDAARAELLARAATIRSGDFRATPSERACHWCDFRRICPSREG